MFQGVFTVIVRIQAGKQQLADIDSFRRRLKSALQDAERDAIAARYGADDVTSAKFALVAFLDEAILSSKDPGREEWRKKTLAVELFGEANAGEVFFDRLQGLIRREEGARLADLLEVYLLCLLLGFEGRYGGALRGESLVLAERVRRRIEEIRSLDYRISPPMELASEAPPPVIRSAPARDLTWLYWMLGILGSALLLFLIYSLHLSWRLEQLRELAGQ